LQQDNYSDIGSKKIDYFIKTLLSLGLLLQVENPVPHFHNEPGKVVFQDQPFLKANHWE